MGCGVIFVFACLCDGLNHHLSGLIGDVAKLQCNVSTCRIRSRELVLHIVPYMRHQRLSPYTGRTKVILVES